MIPDELETALRNTALGGLRYFASTGSTNDEALAWAVSGAADFSLVIADTQTSGRGREGRKWLTVPGSALAFSLVLRPTPAEKEYPGRFSGLGALALVRALQTRGLSARIKWPNDVLLGRRKTAGILVETVWTGAEIDCLVLGMGVNVAAGSVPADTQLNFPAACLEDETGSPVARFDLLRDILLACQNLRRRMAGPEFLQEWQDNLAFAGERVYLWQGEQGPFEVQLLGLEQDGSLKVLNDSGETKTIHFAEVHLRPAD